MCRLFGFRSVMRSGVHESLVSADNALMQQSLRHPDGWGVAYYVAGSPHVIKATTTAISDGLFRHVSGIVSSQTVVAHLRRATQGKHTILESHPFQYGTWILAHNGNLRDFSRIAAALCERIDPNLRRFILGTTDSEILFYLLLTQMTKRGSLDNENYPLEQLAAAIRESVAEITDIAGPLCFDDQAGPQNNFLSFVITNGSVMLAHQGGKALYFSTHKNRCPQRESCEYYKRACETPPQPGEPVSHFLISSEPLSGTNVWEAIPGGHMAGVDAAMRWQRFGA